MNERSLFLGALEIEDEAQRAAFLAEGCAGDAALGGRVERLLQAHAQAGSFLGKPAHQGEGPTVDSSPVTEAPDSHIGPYKLLEQIGEGGMGTVFMAEQEQPVRRKVALKLIKAGMDSRQVIARFEAERQALALMDHANIARVLEAGTTEAGRPYFVMELVKGVPITRYCDDHHLTPQQRLELFMPVCAAVQHAHQKGIIHRDLKPSNVLVAEYDDRPAPKVIDFGIAKAVEQRLTERTLFTGYGQVVGTLEYMSPEQAKLNALDIDTRSDIYSLGVLLYELLTGSPPFDRKRLRETPLDESLRIIREEEPPRPSMRLSTLEELPSIAANRGIAEPRKLSGLVRGELDWIVMKCLEKDRNRRYETANEVVLDVQRYLRDEPVSAGPPSAGYRVRKFVRRNKGPVIAAAVLLLTLTGGIVGTTSGLIRAVSEATRAREAEDLATNRLTEVTQERDRAQKAEKRAGTERDAANAVIEFVRNDLLAQASPGKQSSPKRKPDRDITLRTALDRAAEKAAGRFAKQPLVEAPIRQTLGRAYLDLGDPKTALPHWEAVWKIYHEAHGDEHADTLDAANNLAAVYNALGRYKEGERLLAQTLAVSRRVRGHDHKNTMTAQNNLAGVYYLQGKYAQAEPLLLEALAARRRGKGPSHLVLALNNVAVVYYMQHKDAQAEPLLLEGLEVCRRELGEAHPDRLLTLGTLAAVYNRQGKRDKAEGIYTEALRLHRIVHGQRHHGTVTAMTNLAMVYRQQGKFAPARALLLEALETSRDMSGGRHPDTLVVLNGLGEMYRAQGKYAPAEMCFGEALAGRRQKLGVEHPNTLASMNNLAAAYAAQKKYDRAEPLYVERLQVLRRRPAEGATEVAGALGSLGKCYLEQGKHAEAETVLREALKIREKKTPGDWLVFERKSLLGAALSGQKRYADAEPLLLSGYEGLEARRKDIPATSARSLPDALERLVRLYEAWGKKDKASEWRKKTAITRAP